MISFVVPVFNEEGSIVKTIRSIVDKFNNNQEFEVIVVNDGSTDNTLTNLKEAGLNDIKIINHTENLGYGKSLYDGILAAKHECIAIIDADGSYPVNRFDDLLKYYPEYDMVVGARQGSEFRKGAFKNPARIVFNFLAEYASGRKIPDINSGFRVFRKSIVIKFNDSLCAGFSFTTTITLLFMLNFYYIKYVPIEYSKREGSSKVRHFRDTLRALQIIIEAILYYNPIKLFILLATISLISGLIIGSINLFTYEHILIYFISALLISFTLPIFCLGLLADQLRKIYRR